jgi:hypothetical protein
VGWLFLSLSLLLVPASVKSEKPDRKVEKSDLCDDYIIRFTIFYNLDIALVNSLGILTADGSGYTRMDADE